MRSELYNTMVQTVFSDPSFWQDPQGAMGLFNTYGSNVDSMLQSMFPEYYSTNQEGEPVTP